MTLPVRPPLAPMLAKLARALPAAGYVYEPKWDGFRALAFKDAPEVDLRSRNDRPLARYFPEVVRALLALEPPRVVLDGEIVVARGAELDFTALMARLHPAASRVERLAKETPAAMVVFDLVAIGDEDLRTAPFAERRARLEALLATAPRGLVLTPATTSPEIARAWLDRFHGGGVDGVVAKAPSLPYLPGQRAMVKVKKERTLDAVVAGWRYYRDEPILGSLLLGLYDAQERLVHVGVASQFTTARRRALYEEFAPQSVPLARHPWEHGFNLEKSPLGRLAGSAGRWNPDEMERDWIPLPPARVCEVAYDTVDGARLRYPARFVRWRPDRDPESCRLDQLEEAAPDVSALLAS